MKMTPISDAKNNIEILAPAGNESAVIAAVRSGADAIYLGGAAFNARRGAENFTPESLKNAVEYCHKFRVQVYFTLNISVHENEIESALEEAKMASGCGVDAFIVSDLGLAKILKQSIQGVVLHGSTQMSVSDPNALTLLKELGFTRIVVAREMSKADLEIFCKKAKELSIEVETFVHGALCMCLSGQCYMSAVIGSRSGNRGLCAGPCRLPFATKNTKNGYDLSLKDLSLLDYVEALTQMGVKSFKIEGRMKRPEYVAAVTNAFRNAVDCGEVSEDTKKLLNDVFSRSGFTDGYFLDNVDTNMFGVRTEEDAKISNSVLSQIHALYRNERATVPISAKMVLKQNEASSLTLSDGENEAQVFGAVPETALNRPADYDYLKKQISKLGATEFYLENFECRIDGSLTLPASEINNMRRTACEKLSAARANKKTKEFKADLSLTLTEYENPLNLGGFYARFDNSEQIPDDLSSVAGIILPLDADFEKASLLHQNLFAELPRAAVNSELVENLLQKAAPFIKGAFCGTLQSVGLCVKLGVKAVGGFGLNVYNSHSASVYDDYLCGITVPFETHIKNSKSIKTARPKGVIVYGNLPLMIFKNCPVKQNTGCKECGRGSFITDRKGEKFALLCRFGYTELYNCAPLYSADRAAEFDEFDFKVLYFTNEDKLKTEKIINMYQKGLNADFKYTRGLYKKGVE
ncbi:MAG: U32 family peptidase [Clostridia bacterium]|nr:U32 family peptidase [Clostridia bacterium]